jgi:hypothetical protein
MEVGRGQSPGCLGHPCNAPGPTAGGGGTVSMSPQPKVATLLTIVTYWGMQAGSLLTQPKQILPPLAGLEFTGSNGLQPYKTELHFLYGWHEG